VKRRARAERLAAKQDAARVRNIILGTSTWTPERLEREQSDMRQRWSRRTSVKTTSLARPLESVA